METSTEISALSTISELTFDDDSNSTLINKTSDTKYEIVSASTTYEKYYGTNKKTKPYLTKYEKTKLLGVRAQMLANGSKPLVAFPKHITSTVEIAELELKERKIPLLIRRYLPNNYYEDWRLEDMVVN